MSPASASSLAGPTVSAETLAVVVSAGTTPYLHRTLRAVAGQTLPPDVVLLVDVCSRDNGLGDGTPVEECVNGSGLDDVADVRIVRAPEATTFGDAVNRGLALYRDLVAEGNRRRTHRRPDGRTSVPTSALAPDRRSDADHDQSRQRLRLGPRGERRETGRLDGPADARSPITRSEARRLGAGTGGTTRSSDPGTPATAWLWLLHDDSAPEPDCLERLVTTAAASPSAAVLGPKQVDWDDPSRLLEAGLRTTRSARRALDVVDGEIDQGQLDERSDVLAVGTAGALVRRTFWDEVGGPSPAFGPFGDGLELSRAARLAGHRVVLVPSARVRHRRASYLGLRGPGRHREAAHDERGRRSEGGTEPPVDEQLAALAQEGDPDADRSYRARRTAQLRAWATFSNRPLLLLLPWILLLGLARSLWRLLAKEPALARDETAAAWAALRSARTIREGRRRLHGLRSVPRSVLSDLYATPAEIRAARRDVARQERERLERAAAPSELELRELAAARRRRRRVLGASLVVTAALGLLGTSRVLATRLVAGGALTRVGQDWHELWATAWGTWVPAGDGYPSAMNPLLAIIAVPVALVSRLGLTGDDLVHAVLVLGVPLAALGAWYAAGTITRRTSLRAWAALTWALAPTLLLSLGQGRLPALLVHLVLPWALTALSRAVGADRRDVVLSGLVGAHHASAEEKAELDRFASERVEDLAHLGEEPDDAAPATAAAAGAAGPSQVVDARTGVTRAHADPPEPRDADALEPDAASDVVAPAHDSGTTGTAAAHAGLGDGPVDDDPATPVLDDAEGVVVAATTAHGAAVRAAATEQYGPGSAAAAAVAGLLLCLVVAAEPATAPIVLLLLGGLAVAARRSAARLLLTAVPVLLTAAPAWTRAWELTGSGHAWGEGVRYLLTEAGAPVAASAPSAVELLLGSPVDLDTLAPSPTVSLALKATLAVTPALAVLGLLLGGHRGHRARTGALLVVGGLALAAVAVRVTTAIGTAPDGTGEVLVRAWPGAGLSLALAGMIATVLAAGDAARSALVRHRVGWRHVLLGVLGTACLLVPVAVGGAWAAQAARSTATGADAELMALHPASRAVPLIAEDIASSRTSGRVLLLSSDGDSLTATLWRGDGTRLVDALPDVLSAQRRERVDEHADGALRPTGSYQGSTTSDPALDGTIPTVLTDSADASLADAVARATSGQDPDAAADLAAHDVAVVVLQARTGDEATATARTGLDSTDGLDQLATTTTGTSWRVQPATGEPARAALVTGAGASARSTVVSTSGSSAGRVTADLPGAKDGVQRVLVLAERADDGWRATLDGRALTATTAPGTTSGTWRQAFTVPAEGGRLVLAHDDGWQHLLAPAIWVSWAVAALASLPLRRRRTAA
ncbi:glycosyltransferase [Actinomyces haliotis]|uniref:glycosyltransferase n=1 Tax=Actinomyces haliotis TaxID=1280843 RepID=UPI00188E3458|nr:glycosyltransferase [Actinomyces haliotis]